MIRMSGLHQRDTGDIEDLMSVCAETVRWSPLVDGKRKVQIEFTGDIDHSRVCLEIYGGKIEEKGYNILGVEGPIPIEGGKFLYKLRLEKL